MKTGTRVKLKKGFQRGIITFEENDILRVANYIHKSCVYLKHDGVIDLIRIPYEEMEEYFLELGDTYPPFTTLIGECQNRDWNLSLTYQKINNWSVEIYKPHFHKYTAVYYTDGHMTKEVAIQEALEFIEEQENKK